MAKIDFSTSGDKASAVLGSTTEVFTSCSQVIVTRIVENEPIMNYADIAKNQPVSLPPGSYEFNCMDCKECWVSYEESAFNPDTHVELNC